MDASISKHRQEHMATHLHVAALALTPAVRRHTRHTRPHIVHSTHERVVGGQQRARSPGFFALLHKRECVCVCVWLCV